MEKSIKVYKHPYMWELKIKFGSLAEMLKNATNERPSDEIELGGSFNKAMWKGGYGRAALMIVGVEVTRPNADEITEVKGICKSPWEGVYWYVSCFDEELKQGIYPISADWNGITYIQRWTYKGKDKHGVPIVDKEYYEPTDTWRY